MTERPFTPQSLAERWECTPQHVYKLVRAGKLRCFRLGSLIRIRARDVAAFEDGGGSAGGDQDPGDRKPPRRPRAPVGEVVDFPLDQR